MRQGGNNVGAGRDVGNGGGDRVRARSLDLSRNNSVSQGGDGALNARPATVSNQGMNSVPVNQWELAPRQGQVPAQQQVPGAGVFGNTVASGDGGGDDLTTDALGARTTVVSPSRQNQVVVASYVEAGQRATQESVVPPPPPPPVEVTDLQVGSTGAVFEGSALPLESAGANSSNSSSASQVAPSNANTFNNSQNATPATLFKSFAEAHRPFMFQKADSRVDSEKAVFNTLKNSTTTLAYESENGSIYAMDVSRESVNLPKDGSSQARQGATNQPEKSKIDTRFFFNEAGYNEINQLYGLLSQKLGEAINPLQGSGGQKAVVATDVALQPEQPKQTQPETYTYDEAKKYSEAIFKFMSEKLLTGKHQASAVGSSAGGALITANANAIQNPSVQSQPASTSKLFLTKGNVESWFNNEGFKNALKEVKKDLESLGRDTALVSVGAQGQSQGSSQATTQANQAGWQETKHKFDLAEYVLGQLIASKTLRVPSVEIKRDARNYLTVDSYKFEGEVNIHSKDEKRITKFNIDENGAKREGVYEKSGDASDLAKLSSSQEKIRFSLTKKSAPRENIKFFTTKESDDNEIKSQEYKNIFNGDLTNRRDIKPQDLSKKFELVGDDKKLQFKGEENKTLSKRELFSPPRRFQPQSMKKTVEKLPFSHSQQRLPRNLEHEDQSIEDQSFAITRDNQKVGEQVFIKNRGWKGKASDWATTSLSVGLATPILKLTKQVSGWQFGKLEALSNVSMPNLEKYFGELPAVEQTALTQGAGGGVVEGAPVQNVAGLASRGASAQSTGGGDETRTPPAVANTSPAPAPAQAKTQAQAQAQTWAAGWGGVGLVEGDQGTSAPVSTSASLPAPPQNRPSTPYRTPVAPGGPNTAKTGNGAQFGPVVHDASLTTLSTTQSAITNTPPTPLRTQIGAAYVGIPNPASSKGSVVKTPSNNSVEAGAQGSKPQVGSPNNSGTLYSMASNNPPLTPDQIRVRESMLAMAPQRRQGDGQRVLAEVGGGTPAQSTSATDTGWPYPSDFASPPNPPAPFNTRVPSQYRDSEDQPSLIEAENYVEVTAELNTWAVSTGIGPEGPVNTVSYSRRQASAGASNVSPGQSTPTNSQALTPVTPLRTGDFQPSLGTVEGEGGSVSLSPRIIKFPLKQSLDDVGRRPQDTSWRDSSGARLSATNNSVATSPAERLPMMEQVTNKMLTTVSDSSNRYHLVTTEFLDLVATTTARAEEFMATLNLVPSEEDSKRGNEVGSSALLDTPDNRGQDNRGQVLARSASVSPDNYYTPVPQVQKQSGGVGGIVGSDGRRTALPVNIPNDLQAEERYNPDLWKVGRSVEKNSSARGVTVIPSPNNVQYPQSSQVAGQATEQDPAAGERGGERSSSHSQLKNRYLLEC